MATGSLGRQDWDTEAVEEEKVLPKAKDTVGSEGEKDAGTSRASSGHKAPCYCHKDAI